MARDACEDRPRRVETAAEGCKLDHLLHGRNQCKGARCPGAEVLRGTVTVRV
jgi:hypothetical protein